MADFYPTLVTGNHVNTINFYEDYFGFVPTVEKEGYALLQSQSHPDNCIAVFEAGHECVARFAQPVQGVILRIGVEDIEAVYDTLYMEGLEMFKELGTDINGARHFVVYDPNGILVNVVETISAEARLVA